MSFGAIGTAEWMMDNMKQDALIRSNSLGAEDGVLYPDIGLEIKSDLPNGSLLPASTRSNDHGKISFIFVLDLMRQ